MPSRAVAEKARWLLDERRVRLMSRASTEGGRRYGALVLGESDDYHVWFDQWGVSCDCFAGSDHGTTEPRCSHAVAAMVLWGEILDLVGGSDAD